MIIGGKEKLHTALTILFVTLVSLNAHDQECYNLLYIIDAVSKNSELS